MQLHCNTDIFVPCSSQAGTQLTAKLMRSLTTRMQQLGDSGQERLSLLRIVGERSGWLIEPSDVELGEVLGKGSTATVYKSRWHGLDVAVKVLDPSCFDDLVSGERLFNGTVAIWRNWRAALLAAYGDLLENDGSGETLT